jgi:hypothetical protein
MPSVALCPGSRAAKSRAGSASSPESDAAIEFWFGLTIRWFVLRKYRGYVPANGCDFKETAAPILKVYDGCRGVDGLT